ncbi:mannosyl-glycoprotein endo-beta-N-acetylglucosaminidase domain protein, partial [Streptococcus pyogenes GA06023]
FDTKTQEEYQPGVVTDIVDRFRAYGSWDESILDHGKFLNDNPRYKAVVGETDYKKGLSCYQGGRLCHSEWLCGATYPNYQGEWLAVLGCRSLKK